MHTTNWTGKIRALIKLNKRVTCIGGGTQKLTCLIKVDMMQHVSKVTRLIPSHHHYIHFFYFRTLTFVLRPNACLRLTSSYCRPISDLALVASETPDELDLIQAKGERGSASAGANII